MENKKRKQQAEAILRLAAESGVGNNYLFTTTFDRYQVQMNILDELEKSLAADGMIVTKEYVKNRKNLYTNPAVAEFNRTTDSANKTAATLMKIIRNFSVEEEKEEEDPLVKIINGGD